ncbi:hypothetical protein C8D87_114154 [Lentzea atacamensis]|uniref:Uncharacterized protein n=1 Tax=Lentzea atacamensis TaxID=531938 RepID=A0ABX9DWR4_9PSEU|nr:hypothetical protein [Lentzea atacamensis]RAS59542.1 hypothetical protein C8D87_114154 [Lentzea atacamensis]
MIPDLSGYDTSYPGAQEWLLSDHPWAVTERARRRAAAAGHDFALLARLHLFTEHLEHAVPDPGHASDAAAVQVQNTLAALMVPIEARDLLHGDAAPGDPLIDTVEADRARWEELCREAGDPGYRYPHHLLGPAAEAVDPPGFTYVRPPRQRIADPLENLNGAERARIAFITAAIPVLVDNALVLEVGGYAPVQVVGVYQGKSWYHRHRHGVAELGIGGHPVTEPEQYAEIEADDPQLFLPGAMTTVRVLGQLFARLHPPSHLLPTQ